MNDIFKLFKKRTQAGKGISITDVIKDLNEGEQNEIMKSTSDGLSRFDRANKSYLSISKSGRLKSKKSQNNSRILNEDMFNPVMNSSFNQNGFVNANININNPIYPEKGDLSQTSSKNSSFRSSLEDLPQQQQIKYIKSNNNLNYLLKSNNNYNHDVFFKNSLFQKNY
jgi:hypothetical protein